MLFNTSTYVSRRKELVRSLEGRKGLLLFMGNDDSPMNYEANAYHFRQDSTFIYYFGFHRNAGMYAIIDLDEGREIVFGNELTVEDIVWMGYLPSISEQAAAVGVADTRPAADVAAYLSAAAAKGRTIHYLPPYRAEHRIKLQELLGIPPGKQDEGKSVEFIKAIVNQRNYKTPEEVAEIEKAVSLSYKMHTEAMKVARAGVTEYEVMSVIRKTALGAGGNLSFPIICTVHGETLHNHHYDNVLKNGDMLLMDSGAELANGYAGDISSTMPVSGKFTARQKEVYDIVAAAHRAAVNALKPGVPFREVYYLACRTIVEGMKGLGLMKGDAQEAVMAGAHALFFQCGLGHMMGLDVHDMENLGEVWVGYDGQPKSTQFGMKSLRLGRPLEQGFIITIEPGVYFIPQLIDMWAAEKRFADFVNYDKLDAWRGAGGIRNEEDYLITATGSRMLGDGSEKEAIVKGYF